MEAEEKIKRHSRIIGVCLLAFLFLPSILSYLLHLAGVGTLISQDEILSSCVNILLSILCLFIPFLSALFFIRKDYRVGSLGYEKPVDTKVFLLAVPAGLMLCFFGDYLASVVVTMLSSVGIDLLPMEQTIPTQGISLVLYVVQVVLIPPLIEEFAMRGVALQPLRRYGERYAIFMTAFVFGLMHQNAIQGIFAFTAGLVLGYFAIATESVWTAVIIHALNNAFAVATNVLFKVNEGAANKFYYITTTIIFVGGSLCLLLFMLNKKRHKLIPGAVFMSSGTKTKSFILTAPMIIAIVWMAIQTLGYVSIHFYE